jgi:hypothetical protein
MEVVSQFGFVDRVTATHTVAVCFFFFSQKTVFCGSFFYALCHLQDGYFLLLRVFFFSESVSPLTIAKKPRPSQKWPFRTKNPRNDRGATQGSDFLNFQPKFFVVANDQTCT